MKAKDYLTTWLDKKYGGSPEIGDWTPEDVTQFADDLVNINTPFTESEIKTLLIICKDKKVNKSTMLHHELGHIINKLNKLINKN